MVGPDFRPGWVDTFDKKTNEEDPDRSDLKALVEVLGTEDQGLLERLSTLVDLPRFYTFWAMEILLMHADGYTRNTNNFYLYSDPDSGQLVFLPWGIDVILDPDKVWSWEQQAPPGLTWVEGLLARRLYGLPEAQQGFVAALERLLAEVWSEDHLEAEIDRMKDLLWPQLLGMPAGELALVERSMESVRDFVLGRRAQIETLLAQGLPSWDQPLRDPWCVDPVGEVSAEFAGRWGLPPGEGRGPVAEGVVEMLLGEDHLVAEGAAFVAWMDPATGVGLLRFSTQASLRRRYLVEVELEPLALSGCETCLVELAAGSGSVRLLELSVTGEVLADQRQAVFGGGELVVTTTGLESGAPLRGSLVAPLYAPL